MNLPEIETKICKGEILEFTSKAGDSIEVFGGNWNFHLSVNGVVVKSNKTASPILKELVIRLL